MAKKNVERKNIKQELKEEVKTYNQKTNRNMSDLKHEFEKNNIELTEKQHELYKCIRNNTFTMVQGPAGTSKTFTSCYASLALLADRKINTIILTKPIKESGEELGYLPGDINDKVGVYMRSYFSNFEKIIGKENVSHLSSKDKIKIEPLAYMRGNTYDNSIILLDEAQNATIKQLMLWITRLGKNSKAVLMGDISQYDIKKRESKFFDFIQMVSDIKNVGSFSFSKEDIVRNEILIEIVDRYEKMKSEGKFD